MHRTWILLFFVFGCSGTAITGDVNDVSGKDAQIDLQQDLKDLHDADVYDSENASWADPGISDITDKEIGDFAINTDEGNLHDGYGDISDIYDPSDAPEWHPGLTTYPRLFFGPEDVDKIKRSVQSWANGAASGAMQRLRSRCAQTVPTYTDDYDPYVDKKRAKIAKACAFLAFEEGDRSAADKAMDILRTIRTSFKGIDYNSPFYTKWDILVAEAIEAYLFTYDLLAAADIRGIVVLQQPVQAFCDAVFDYGTKQAPKAMLIYCQNNHAVKFASAIGMCGMMFNHSPKAALYVDFAATFVDFLMDHIIDKDGGDAEGPGYNVYASVNYLPFFATYHRLIGGPVRYKALDLLRLNPPAQRYVTVQDFILNPKILANNDWFLNILMPDGQAPNIEDSNLTPALSGLIAGVFRDPRFMANWGLPTVNYSRAASDMLPESLCALGDFNKATPYVPDPVIIMSDAGQAVFRGKDRSWLMVLAEHGNAVAHGNGHEQMDPTQWLYAAMGEYLVIDSGYIQWEKRDLVAHPKNHNMILVDGAGPDDGILSNPTNGFFDRGDDHNIGAQTQYRGCQIHRKYYFFDETVAILSIVDCDKSHKLSQFLHLNAGGDTDGEVKMQGDGVFRMTRPKAIADGINTCIGAACSYSQHEAFHAFTWGQKHTHAVLSSAVTGSSAVFFDGLFTSAPDTSTQILTGRIDRGLCFVKVADNAEALCQCQEQAGCSIRVNDYVITIETGFTRVIFDTSTLKIIDFYGSPPKVEKVTM